MKTDVVVVGAGVSGLSFAWKATQAGRKVTVLEREGRIGGCFHSHRRPDGFWFEMGAHTCYNSYGGFLEIAVGTGASKKMLERGPARAHFGLLRNGEYVWLTPPKILLELDWLEAAAHFPLNFLQKKDGETVYSYYSKLLGRGNYDRIFSPFFAAVPSQKADGFPLEGAGSLFKKRPRKKEFARSFGFEGGIQTVLDAAASAPGLTLEKGVSVAQVKKEKQGYSVRSTDGRLFGAEIVAVASSVDEAPLLVQEDFHELSRVISRVESVGVESTGVVLARDGCFMPEVAFLVPVDDVFYSCVTRDPFPDLAHRGFAFHFRPGLQRADRLKRISEVLRVKEEELGDPIEQRVVLPAPALGHDRVVAEVDRCLSGERLAVTGNYFEGLAVEDCVVRSFSEWDRVSRG